MEAMECDYIFDENHDEIIEEFGKVTNNSLSFSEEYLKNHSWDMQVAMDNYFEDNLNAKIVRINVFSWNLDGLDNNHIELRTMDAVKTILENEPDFIFLQELVSRTECILRNSLDKYYIFYVDSQPDTYYCGILIKRLYWINAKGNLEVVPFVNSEMGRRLLMLKVTIGDLDVLLMTSHLESLKESSFVRMEQLKNSFERMNAVTCSSIFAGDMNIRDYEIAKMNGLPNGIFDLAQILSSDNILLPTWEPKNNVNIPQHLSRVPGLRFDRMYVHLIGNVLNPIEFKRLVTIPSEEYNLHPSDHWGIQGIFSLS